MNANRPIYRSDAVARYVAARQEAILPRMVRPRTQRYLWIGLLFLFILTGLAWWTELPIYQSGVGTLLINRQSAASSQLVVLFPSTTSTDEITPRTMVVTLPTGERLIVPMDRVSATPLSPAEVRAQYPQLPPMELLSGPVVVATASLDETRFPQPMTLWEGSLMRVESQSGAYRLLSLLPVIGGWFA